jgi:hypothetical protein
LVVMALGGPANKHGVAAAIGIRWAAAALFVASSLLQPLFCLNIGKTPSSFLKDCGNSSVGQDHRGSKEAAAT